MKELSSVTGRGAGEENCRLSGQLHKGLSGWYGEEQEWAEGVKLWSSPNNSCGQSYLELGQNDQAFIFPQWCVTGCGPPWNGCELEQGSSHQLRGLRAVGCLLTSFPAAFIKGTAGKYTSASIPGWGWGSSFPRSPVVHEGCFSMISAFQPPGRRERSKREYPCGCMHYFCSQFIARI